MIEYLYIEHVCNKDNLHNVIYPDLDHDYYWSDDFSCKFFIVLAKAGFITIGYVNEEVPIILHQLQTHYALLEHKDLHVSHHVKKLLQKNTYHFSTNERFKEVIEKASKKATKIAGYILPMKRSYMNCIKDVLKDSNL